ncbi:PAS domain-containing protein [candidate division WOR-3 bacterium]|nr:PAS domain-containing protein [candidate division WOR-3 bacterium]
MTKKTFLDSTSTAIVLTDSEGKILLVNPACERLYGIEKNSIEGQNIEFFFCDSSEALVSAIYSQISLTGEYSDLLTHRKKGGEEFYALMQGSRAEISEKAFSGVVFSIHDLTDLLKYRFEVTTARDEKIVLQRKEWQKTARKIIHDIKTPIATVGSVLNAIHFKLDKKDKFFFEESLSDLIEIEKTLKSLLSGG